MGYYSEVGIVMEEKAYQGLVKSIKKFEFENEKLYEELDWLVVRGVDDSYIVKQNWGYSKNPEIEYRILHWNSVKWYEHDFPEIDYIMAYIRSLKDYHYIRLGEHWDDTEIESNGDISDLIYIERRIDLPGN